MATHKDGLDVTFLQGVRQREASHHMTNADLGGSIGSEGYGHFVWAYSRPRSLGSIFDSRVINSTFEKPASQAVLQYNFLNHRAML